MPTIPDSRFEEIVKEKVRVASDHKFDDCVKILPWIGSHYSKTRILLVGESVWEDPETDHKSYPEREAAIRVTEEGRWRKARLRAGRITGNFTNNIFRYMTGLNAAEARDKFPGMRYVEQWEQWAFWDIIQRRLKGHRDVPNHPDWTEGVLALRHIAQELKPRLVLGLSCRMYEHVSQIAHTPLLCVRHPSWFSSGDQCRETYRSIQTKLDEIGE